MKKAVVILVALMFFWWGSSVAYGEEYGNGQTSATMQTLSVVQTKPASPKMSLLKIKVGGGVQTFQQVLMGEHHPVDNFLRASIFVKGVVNPKLGFFYHAMYLYYPVEGKILNFFAPVAFVWWNPAKFIGIKAGSLKKPSEVTFLAPWMYWTFVLPPQMYGLLSKEKLCFVDSGVQLDLLYKKLVNVQFNVFRTDNALKNQFNLLYYTGLNVTPSFGAIKPGLTVFYSFEPHYGIAVSYATGKPVEMAQRSSLTAAGWVSFKGTKLFVEYITMNLKGSVKDLKSTGYDIEFSYAHKIKGFTIIPKVRYDFVDPRADVTGESKTAIIPGVDFILAMNPKTKLMYKAGIEYQINKEETNEVKNDVLRLILQVGGF